MADGNYPTYVTQARTIIWTAAASGTVRPAGSFVNFAGTSAFTGLGFLGVLSEDLPANATGVPVGVDVEGTVQVIAGAAVAVGAALSCQNANGQFITAVAGNQIHGRALTLATAAGQKMLMHITREGIAA
jgi:hypothetical protein